MVKTIGQLFDLYAGGDINKAAFSPVKDYKHPYPIYSNGLQNEGLYGYTSAPKYNGNSITITGRGSVGTPMYREKPFDAIIRLLVLSAKNDKEVCVKYVSEYISKCVSFSQESTGVPQLTVPQIRDIELMLPPLPEQNAIASTLSNIDAYIAALEKLIDKNRAIKQGTMQELLTGNRRLPGFNGEWVETTLGGCFKDIVGGGTPARGIAAYWNGSIPWVTVKDFATFTPTATQEYISTSGLSNSATHLIPSGTLITPTRMGLGRIIVYAVDVTINQDLKALFIADNIERDFIRFWFEFNAKSIEELGTGSTVKGIRIEQLKKIEIVVPPTRQEQTAILEVLSDMDAEIDALTTKLNKAKHIKQGIMSELLTGRIRLIDEEDE